MLEDRFGRQFYYLRLSITEACNFRCQYCLPDGYQGPSHEHFLNLEEIRTLISGFAQLGTQKIRITGGEPSLRRDLSSVIDICRHTPGIKKVAMTTHGGRLAQNIASWHAAGLDQINVSIDSLDPRQFAAITGQDKLLHILKGIDMALEGGMKVKVNTVLLKDFSQHRLSRFLDWIRHTPVTLRFIELMQTGDHEAFFKQQHLSGIPLRTQLLEQGWKPLPRELDAGPAQEFSHPDYAGRIGLILPYSKDFCLSCNRLRVAANGNLHLCLFSEQGVSLRPFLQSSDPAELKGFLQEVMASKHATHHLNEGNTGATRHLAMLGG
ncbi:GTP 3',8-cyclase MoaA [Alteromonas aestuariivivens]|uniref:GTP 3',8-cyclase n=1 Tax=Alteromonas aestuariivivens TaxID=1938339 RepID=A0A3D8M3P9_9ALTE|nr:GTP 3',8-cyclase MoaA [Alteromonas aestuariivivens]RDV24319.1 GTP 3',8-cyclase MoaA [Alteromonas aestuariivivens]